DVWCAFFFSSRRRHTRLVSDWSSDVCSSDLCRRLIRSGMLPGRGGQPTQVLVHMTLGQLRGIPGATAGTPRASAAEDAWAAARRSEERRVGKRGGLGGGRELKKENRRR